MAKKTGMSYLRCVQKAGYFSILFSLADKADLELV